MKEVDKTVGKTLDEAKEEFTSAISELNHVITETTQFQIVIREKLIEIIKDIKLYLEN